MWRGRDQPRWRWRWAPSDGRAEAGDAIAALSRKYGCAAEMREQRIAIHWREIVGDLVASRAWPDGLDGGVLWVEAKTSAWVHQLSFLRDEIRQRANEVVGDPPLVRDVRFFQGERTRRRADDVLAMTRAIGRQPPEQRSPPAPAANERLRAIKDEADKIADDELRELIVSVRRRWDL
jgi:hypothetical protein